MSFNQAIKDMGMLDFSTNVFLRTFLNTASSTFDNQSEISIWTSNPDVLCTDLRDMDKLILSILTTDESDSNLFQKRINIFKDVLSVDFKTDFRVTNTALKIPMLELWSTTQLKHVWIDKTVFNFVKEDKGKTILIPYDYFLFDKPILFLGKDTDLETPLDNTIKVSNISSISKYLPYIEYIIP